MLLWLNKTLHHDGHFDDGRLAGARVPDDRNEFFRPDLKCHFV